MEIISFATFFSATYLYKLNCNEIFSSTWHIYSETWTLILQHSKKLYHIKQELKTILLELINKSLYSDSFSHSYFECHIKKLCCHWNFKSCIQFRFGDAPLCQKKLYTLKGDLIRNTTVPLVCLSVN